MTVPNIKLVSRELHRIWLFLAWRYREDPSKWTSAAELVNGARAAPRTARHHLQRLALLGLVEQQSIFSGLRSRLTDPSKHTAQQKALVNRLLAEQAVERTDQRVVGLTFRGEVAVVCDSIANMLIQKRAAYGDSALTPLRIFSSASTREQLLVRIDDKLSRIVKGKTNCREDAIGDLIGYLILLKVYDARNTPFPEKSTNQ